MPGKDQISDIKLLLKKASASILEVYHSGIYSVQQKADFSPLTLADTISNSIIINGLKSITPDIPVISEETLHLSYEERSLFKEVWILDPIDGTREFVSGNGEFCISLALIRDNRPVFGFILAPVTGELWYAIKGEGAFREKDGEIIRLPIREAPSDNIVITISRSHHNDAEKAWIDNITRLHESQVLTQGSAIKFCKLAEGVASVYPKFGSINEWDIAAGDMILTEVGGEVVETLSGREPRYNKPDLKQPFFIAYAPGIRGKIG
jgi:3'(2'), 5'-bisphosphate nucleotidase